MARRSPPVVVAIPVRDEADRIGACLDALAMQLGLDGAPLAGGTFGVLLLLNNCRDGTAGEVARRLPRLPFELRVMSRDLAPAHAHAGAARRLAMDAAAGWLRESRPRQAAILTTDADTRVAPDWVARHHALFARGFDGIAGHIAGDPAEADGLPAALRRRGRLEARYAALLTEIRARLAPEPHDPWPCHSMAGGASLGVTLDAYEAVGGVPLRRTGEDRALLAELARRDARIRHCPQIRVVTSCRLAGRAAGGMAATLRQRLADPDAPCDEALEPVLDALHRSFWRATLRDLHARGGVTDAEWPEALGIAREVVPDLGRLACFGEFWHRAERLSPSLRRRRLHPRDLPVELSRARGVLGWLRTQPIPRPFDIASAS